MIADEPNGLGFDPLAWMKESADDGDYEMVAPAPKRTEHPENPATAALGVVTLAATLAAATANELAAELRTALDAGGPVSLDAAAVERIDGVSIQLLAAFCRSAADADVTVHWQSPSQSLCDAVRLLGLSAVLGLAQ